MRELWQAAQKNYYPKPHDNFLRKLSEVDGKSKNNFLQGLRG
jgi:hypothetical protein